MIIGDSALFNKFIIIIITFQIEYNITQKLVPNEYKYSYIYMLNHEIGYPKT